MLIISTLNTKECLRCYFIPIFKKERTKNIKKLFISQPMNGKAAEELLREPVEVIDSFFRSAQVGSKPLWFLGKSLELLSDADIAYFAKDWQKARGCKIEHECAVEYGIPRIEHA